MNGGRNAAVGYLYQHLICVLDSFQDDWDSVIVEPHTDQEKVDILWLYETGREKYKKAVQVKSTQNIFNGEEILRIAEEIKNNFKDANEYELILIGSITRKLRKYLKQNHNRHAGVKIIKSDIFCLEAFIGCACDKLDTYLNDKFDPQLPRRHRENIVLNLIGQLLYYSTNGREVTRVQFEAGLQDWVQSYVSPSGYELRNNTEFHRLYGFNAPPTKRIAIEKIYKQSGEIRQDFFKKCLNFLTIDESDKTKLKVVYPKVDMIFFYFGMCVQLVDFMIFAFFVYIHVAVYAHWIFMLVATIPCAIIIGMVPLVQSYFIARKIDREVQRLRIQ